MLPSRRRCRRARGYAPLVTQSQNPKPETDLTELQAGAGMSAGGYVALLGLDARPARRRVLLNMVCTVDGRATIGGTSGAIGGPADRGLFHALRGVCDAVLIGAGTARAERYGPLVKSADARAEREGRGLAPQPLACIVSQSLNLDRQLPLLADPASRVVAITGSDGTLPDSAAQVDYIRAPGDGGIDLAAALDELERRFGARTVLCEGGPRLGGELIAGGLLDELWLSIAPRVAAGQTDDARRIVTGPELQPPAELRLLGAAQSGSELFLRYALGSPVPVSRATID